MGGMNIFFQQNWKNCENSLASLISPTGDWGQIWKWWRVQSCFHTWSKSLSNANIKKIIKKLWFPKIIIHRQCWEREKSLQKRFRCIQLSSPTWLYFGFIPINTLDNLSILSDYIWLFGFIQINSLWLYLKQG